MLEVDSPIGNVFLDKEFEELKSKKLEKLVVSRIELEKRILRRRTDQGTDVGLNLNLGVKLHHGDIIKNGDTKIIIEQAPEKVISVRLKTKNSINVMVLLGHIIGNRHRPISIQNDKILFPIQADSEKDIFIKLFQSILDHIEVTIEECIFLPHKGANAHEH